MEEKLQKTKCKKMNRKSFTYIVFEVRCYRVFIRDVTEYLLE